VDYDRRYWILHLPERFTSLFLVYAKKVNFLKKWWAYFVLYLPVVIFLFQTINHDLFITDVVYSPYGWMSVSNLKSIWFWAYYSIIALSGLINIYLCFALLKEKTPIRERKRTRVILIFAIISFVFSFGYNLFTRIIFQVDIPEITVAGLMIWILGILYAIIKYRLMILSPTLVAESILETINDSVILVNPDNLITYINSETLSLLRYKKIDLLEKPFGLLFPNDIKPEMANISETLVHGPISNKDTFFLSKNSIRIPILFSATVCNDNEGNYLGFVALSRDFTEYRRREDEIKFLSYHDQLTGLYNRRYYEEELKRFDTIRNLPISIIMGDVNGLKAINDTYGHDMGDELLKKVTRAIIKGCRIDDVIARLGGDEFVVLLTKTDQVQTEQIIQRINKLLKNEKVGNRKVTVSFGYKVKMNEHEKIQDTFKAAEDQMYKYKNLHSTDTRHNSINLCEG
jgi:diguanylate cyclase (GGDEF)-like protein/PAS domain S-box-containing protein